MAIFDEYGNPTAETMRPIYDKIDELAHVVDPIADKCSSMVEARALWSCVIGGVDICALGYILRNQDKMRRRGRR